MKLIDYHKRWEKQGHIDCFGLCKMISDVSIDVKIDYKETFYLLKPTEEDFAEIKLLGESETYWGSGLKLSDNDRCTKYTERRQNIVLFICAMHDEL